MKVTQTEQVTRTYCDVCERQLTNRNLHALDSDTVHLCMDSPNEGKWKTLQDARPSVLIGKLPSCYDMYYAGVRKIYLRGHPHVTNI